METTTTLQRTSGNDLINFLKSPSVISSIKSSCARHTTPERLVRVACAALSRQPQLMNCTKESLFLALTNCGQLGLEPNLLGSAYLVPYKNFKTGKTEAQFIPGYRGLIDLARRSGEISSIESHPVYEKDYFEFELGLQPKMIHRPYLGDEDSGKLRFVYALAVLKDGSKQLEVMSKRDIELIRGRSKAGTSGPWVTDYSEMAKKTVLRRLVKYLPLSVELTEALEKESEFEAGEIQFVPTPDETTDSIESQVIEDQKSSKTMSLKEKIKTSENVFQSPEQQIAV